MRSRGIRSRRTRGVGQAMPITQKTCETVSTTALAIRWKVKFGCVVCRVVGAAGDRSKYATGVDGEPKTSNLRRHHESSTHKRSIVELTGGGDDTTRLVPPSDDDYIQSSTQSFLRKVVLLTTAQRKSGAEHM